jgi:hypothetical protein
LPGPGAAKRWDAYRELNLRRSGAGPRCYGSSDISF